MSAAIDKAQEELLRSEMATISRAIEDYIKAKNYAGAVSYLSSQIENSKIYETQRALYKEKSTFGSNVDPKIFSWYLAKEKIHKVKRDAYEKTVLNLATRLKKVSGDPQDAINAFNLIQHVGYYINVIKQEVRVPQDAYCKAQTEIAKLYSNLLTTKTMSLEDRIYLERITRAAFYDASQASIAKICSNLFTTRTMSLENDRKYLEHILRATYNVSSVSSDKSVALKYYSALRGYLPFDSKILSVLPRTVEEVFLVNNSFEFNSIILAKIFLSIIDQIRSKDPACTAVFVKKDFLSKAQSIIRSISYSETFEDCYERKKQLLTFINEASGITAKLGSNAEIFPISSLSIECNPPGTADFLFLELPIALTNYLWKFMRPENPKVSNSKPSATPAASTAASTAVAASASKAAKPSAVAIVTAYTTAKTTPLCAAANAKTLTSVSGNLRPKLDLKLNKAKAINNPIQQVFKSLINKF